MKNRTLTALIVGAEAVENAWSPVLRALQPHVDFPLTADGANCFLARVVYLLRWWSSSPGDMAAGQLRRHKEFLSKIKKDICREIRISEGQGELKVRAEFQAVLDVMLLAYSNSFMLVTTNWDAVVPDALSKYLSQTMDGSLIPLHIHGDTTTPDTLYLPTEVTKEPYRSYEEDQKIGRLHGDIWRGLEKAHRVVVYGVSLSPLDAELGQTLSAGWSNSNLREIVVVSPEYATVAHRVNLLLDPRHEVAVTGYLPQDLKNGTDYTVRRSPRKK